MQVGVPVPDPSVEAKAVVSLVGRSLGFDTLPLAGGGPGAPLMSVEEAVGWVAGAGSVSASAKLELLGHLSRSALPRSALEPIAVSLVRPDLQHDDPAALVDEILDRVYAAAPGEDPLGRNASELLPDGDDLLRSLVHDLQITSLSVVPRCQATSEMIGGNLAISLATVVKSHRSLGELSALVDPREWPRCPLQAVFFKRMDLVVPAAPPPPSLVAPDAGWSARLSEVVDFSFGLDPTGDSLTTTELDFVYFETALSVGCTYDLGRSVDAKILVDRGYILVEDLASLGVRRTTTLKQVSFANRPQPGSEVCRFWSLAQALVGSSCLSQPHSVVGSTS